MALACCAALLAGLPAGAAADRDYRAVFSENRQGDITGTGNTLMSCFDSDRRCSAARNGTASGSDLNNNGLPMDWVDVDGNAGTFNSSTATLSLPAGARVLAARLYYTGRLQQGADSTYQGQTFKSRPAPDPGRRNKVLFKPPGLNAYLTLTAGTVDDSLDPKTNVAREYQGIVDVTDLVAAAGSGEYMVANVQLGTGLDADQAGGWALAVAYEDVNQPTRNLTIFDGFRFVLADGPPVDIPLIGFRTPPTGPVTTNLGLVAIEGDLGTTGDSATINAGTAEAFTLFNAGNRRTTSSTRRSPIATAPSSRIGARTTSTRWASTATSSTRPADCRTTSAAPSCGWRPAVTGSRPTASASPPTCTRRA
jgi:hypothetical protein